MIGYLLTNQRESRRMRTDEIDVSSTKIMRDWARILLACEANAGGTSVQNDPATVRVYDRLRSQLCRLVGATGFRALASRALRLAKSISPELSAVQIASDGCLLGIGEVESPPDSNPDGEVGIILIAQLLGLFLTLVGEATTRQLIEDLRLQLEVATEWVATAAGATALRAAGPETLEALDSLLREIDRLRSVSERLETMAHKHPCMEQGLVSVAGNIRSIATVLDVLTLIRSKAEPQRQHTSKQSSSGYVM